METDSLAALVDQDPAQLVPWARQRAAEILGGREPLAVLDGLRGSDAGGLGADYPSLVEQHAQLDVSLIEEVPASIRSESADADDDVESAVTAALDELSTSMLEQSLVNPSSSASHDSETTSDANVDDSTDDAIEVLDEAEFVELDPDELELLAAEADEE